MKVKQIEWRDYEGMMLGYVGKIKLFTYSYCNIGTYRFQLTTRLPFPPRFFNSREECEVAAQAELQKFVALVTY